MSTLQIPHILDSVLEDQESSNVKAEPAHASSTTLSQPLRKLSFSNRRHSFGLSSLPAVAAAQAAQAQPIQTASNTLNASDTLTTDGTSLSSLTSISRKLSSNLTISRRASRIEDPDTLKPNLPGSQDSSRTPSRKGVINIDESSHSSKTTIESPDKKIPVSIIPEEKPKDIEKPKWKKYKIESSSRFPVIPKDQLQQKACVGAYNPYPNHWPKKDGADKKEWAKMVSRFSEKPPQDTHLGPGTYPLKEDKSTKQCVAFKSKVSRFRKPFKSCQGNPNLGPGFYSLEPRDMRQINVPWVKGIQKSLGRVIDYKNPIDTLTQLQLQEEASKDSKVPSFMDQKRLLEIKSRGMESNESKKTKEIEKPLHPLSVKFLMSQSNAL